MVVHMPTGEGRRRLKEIDQDYRQKHIAANAVFRKRFDELLAKHGLEFNAMSDIHSLPAAFYEELRPLQEAHVGHISAAQGERGRQVKSAPTRAVRIQRG